MLFRIDSNVVCAWKVKDGEEWAWMSKKGILIRSKIGGNGKSIMVNKDFFNRNNKEIYK